MNKAKLYKLSNTILSILIALLAIYFLIDLFNSKQEARNFKSLFSQLYTSKFSLVLIFLLMPLNWLVETYKWFLLTNRSQSITFYKSLQSILLGVLFSILSPNRIGELGGRLVFIKKDKLLPVFYTNLFCSFSQLFATLLFGLIAILYFGNEIGTYFNLNPNFIILLAITFILLILFFFFYSNILMRLMQFFSKKIKFANEQFLDKVSVNTRMTLLLLSILRYAIFSLQFYIALQIFKINIEGIIVFSAIALVFFLATIIPTAWISDLPVRGSIAYLVFNQIGAFGIEGLFCSMLLWSVNLFLPALFGLFVLPKVNWLKLKKLRF